MPGDDGVSSLRESMKQDYRHIGTLAKEEKKKKKETQALFRGQLLVGMKMLLTFFSVIYLLAVPCSLDIRTSQVPFLLLPSGVPFPSSC